MHLAADTYLVVVGLYHVLWAGVKSFTGPLTGITRSVGQTDQQHHMNSVLIVLVNLPFVKKNRKNNFL